MKIPVLTSLFLLFILFISGCSDTSATLEIISLSTSKPLANHRIVLYKGDISFKMALGTNPCPYDSEDRPSWFLDEPKTSESGLLTINKTYGCQEILLVLGKPYKNISISFSDNLSHNFSKDHIRIVDFIGTSTRVQGNFIYDLRNKTVTYYKLDGSKTEKKFKYITLHAVESPAPLPKNMPK